MKLTDLLKKVSVFICSFFLIVCCQGNEEKALGDTAPKMEKSDLDFIGITVPFYIQKNENYSIYTMGLSPHARTFFLKDNMRYFGTTSTGREAFYYSSDFLLLLKNSEEKDIPLRVYVFPNTNEVYWVEEATAEEIKKYEDSRQPPID